MKRSAGTRWGCVVPETIWPEQVTLGIAGLGLGDVWRSVQYACHVNRTHGVRAKLYSGWHGWPGMDFSPRPIADRAALIREITPLLDTRGHFRLVKTADLSKVIFTQWFSRWSFPLVRSSVRWKGWSRRRCLRFTCQLDGTMAGGAKNPPRRDLSLLRTALSGVEVIPLGRHLSVRACLEAMASSDLFFGVDSGMMQLAYSVGVPAFLLKYRGDELVLWKWHGDRHAIHCGGTVDFLNLARAFLGREG